MGLTFAPLRLCVRFFFVFFACMVVPGRRFPPPPYPLPISLIFRAEMLLHELFFERDQPEINEPEKNNRRNDEPEAFNGEKASNGDEKKSEIHGIPGNSIGSG